MEFLITLLALQKNVTSGEHLENIPGPISLD